MKNLSTYILSAVGTILIVLSGIVINSFGKQNALLNQQNDDLNKVYIREAVINERLNNIEQFRSIDSLKTDVKYLKSKIK